MCVHDKVRDKVLGLSKFKLAGKCHVRLSRGDVTRVTSEGRNADLYEYLTSQMHKIFLATT